MKKIETLMIDVDDTLAALQTDLLKNIKKVTGFAPPYYQIDVKELERQRSFDNPITRQFLDSPELAMSLKPFPKSLEGFKMLFEAGYELHISSSRLEPVHEVTHAWLKKHGFYPYIKKIHPRSSSIKGRDFKIMVANEINAVAAFDDTPTIVDNMINNGTTLYLIRRPWNKHISKSKLVKPLPSFYQAVRAFLTDQHKL